MGSEHFFIRGLNTKTQTVVFYLTQSGSSDKPNPVGFFYYTRTVLSSQITILQKKLRTNDYKRACRMSALKKIENTYYGTKL